MLVNLEEGSPLGERLHWAPVRAIPPSAGFCGIPSGHPSFAWGLGVSAKGLLQPSESETQHRWVPSFQRYALQLECGETAIEIPLTPVEGWSSSLAGQHWPLPLLPHLCPADPWV